MKTVEDSHRAAHAQQVPPSLTNGFLFILLANCTVWSFVFGVLYVQYLLIKFITKKATYFRRSRSSSHFCCFSSFFCCLLDRLGLGAACPSSGLGARTSVVFPAAAIVADRSSVGERVQTPLVTGRTPPLVMLRPSAGKPKPVPTDEPSKVALIPEQPHASTTVPVFFDEFEFRDDLC